jgi:hypothetical protein
MGNWRGKAVPKTTELFDFECDLCDNVANGHATTPKGWYERVSADFVLCPDCVQQIRDDENSESAPKKPGGGVGPIEVGDIVKIVSTRHSVPNFFRDMVGVVYSVDGDGTFNIDFRLEINDGTLTLYSERDPWWYWPENVQWIGHVDLKLEVKGL